MIGRTARAAIVLLALGSAALLWWVISPASVTVEPSNTADGSVEGSGPVWIPPRFPEYTVAPEILEAWRVERDGLSPTPTADAVDLLAAWQRHNFAEGLAAIALFEGDVGGLKRDLDERAAAYARAHGAGAYVALSWRAYAEFEVGLRDLTEEARAGGRSLRALLRDPTAPVVREAYERCGAFLHHGLANGLFTDTGTLLLRPETAALLFRAKWVADVPGVTISLPGAEARALLRWRLEALPRLSVSSRLLLIDTYFGAEHEAPYSIEFARAVVYAEAGDVASARAALDRDARSSAHTPRDGSAAPRRTSVQPPP